MTTVLEPPAVSVGTGAADPTGADAPLRDAVPWVVRAAIAPRTWQEADSCWLESNGSEGCYGGWELRFPVSAAEGDELVFELHAEASNLARGSDALIVEAFWHGADEKQRDWDPVFFDGGYPVARFTTRLRCPAGATELRVRCGLRWSHTGRVRWHGWRLHPVAKAPHRLLRLGVASQKPPAWTDMWGNRDHYVAQCRRAGEAGIGLVCLPELIFTIGMPQKGPDDVVTHALPIPGEWLQPFQDVARQYRMGICFSTYERGGEHGEIAYNTAILLGQDGALIGTYRKVHLALGEARNGVAAGHEFPVYDFHGINVGMLICMDSSPQESTRILARKGAEIMLMPIAGDFRANEWKARGERGAAKPHGGAEAVEGVRRRRDGGYTWDAERWKLVQRAHAFDSHLFTAVARNSTAGSSVTAPWGDILAFDDGSSGLVWADIDVDDRRRHPTGSTMQAVLLSMRRPYTYGALTDTNLPVSLQPNTH